MKTRFWLHVPGDWRFFAPERLLSRLAAILDAEPDVLTVGVNYEDAAALTGHNSPEDITTRGAGTGRYVLTKSVPRGPAMFDTERLAQIGGIGVGTGGMRTATLDEVLCVSA